MSPIPVTLLAAAAGALVNIWLGWRIAAHRKQFQVSVGDGGHEPLLRRMRAQSNFVEHAPIFLILVAALEIGGANKPILGLIAVIFGVARVSHALGMDRVENRRWRSLGMMATVFSTVALVLWAIATALELN